MTGPAALRVRWRDAETGWTGLVANLIDQLVRNKGWQVIPERGWSKDKTVIVSDKICDY